MGRRCLILVSHRLDPVTLARFAQCRSELGADLDVHLVLSEPLQAEVASHGLRDTQVMLSEEIFLPAYGAKSATGRIKPGNADLILLAFWRRNPGYDAIWVMEYDVFAPQGLGRILVLDRASGADLLGSFLRDAQHEPGWMHWPGLRLGPRLDGSPVPAADRRACFLPLSRVSARLLATLDQAYRQAWLGHHEAVLATVAQANGLELADLNTIAVRALGHAVYDYAGFNPAGVVAGDGRAFYHPVRWMEEAAALVRALDQAGSSASPSPVTPTGGAPIHQTSRGA